MLVDQLQRTVDDHKHRFDILEKHIDDLLWFERLGDVAHIDKVRLSSTPRWKPKDKEYRFANNKLQFYYYVFIPKDINRKKKYPLIILPHSGMIALMQILQHGDIYQCAFAGVPVSDLENRLESHDETYSAYFTASHHIGESIENNPEEYARRSPNNYAAYLNKPLLIFTNNNDNDVYVEEVQLMIDTLKKLDRKVEYRIFEEASGGHGFDRIGSREATDIRFTIHNFLAKLLKPNKPFKNTTEMHRAAYRF